MIIDNIVLWGAGEIARLFLKHIDKSSVLAIIDSSKEKVGKDLDGVSIIDYDTYLKDYSKCYIVITGLLFDDIIAKLEECGNNKYFLAIDCPGEWLEENARTEFVHHVESKIKLSRKPIVYGCNYYSIYIANTIFKIDGTFPTLVYNEKTNADLLKSLENDYPDISFKRLKEIDDYSDIYITEDRRKGFDNEVIDKSANVIELWDCALEIEDYSNERISLFKNIHSQDRCFIVGLGPSLRMEDLDLICMNNDFSISMNDCFRAFEKTKWRPDYYVISDNRTIKEEIDLYSKLPIDVFFISDQCGEPYNSILSKNLGNRLIKYHIHRATNADLKPKFTSDFSKTAYYGTTVTYIALQLAAYMGFKNIYLLGVDATGLSNKTGNTSTQYNHFYEEKEMTGAFFEPYMTLAYQSAREYSECHGFNIFNATRGGELEVFERVDFDSLFSETKNIKP